MRNLQNKAQRKCINCGQANVPPESESDYCKNCWAATFFAHLEIAQNVDQQEKRSPFGGKRTKIFASTRMPEQLENENVEAKEEKSLTNKEVLDTAMGFLATATDTKIDIRERNDAYDKRIQKNLTS